MIRGEVWHGSHFKSVFGNTSVKSHHDLDDLLLFCYSGVFVDGGITVVWVTNKINGMWLVSVYALLAWLWMWIIDRWLLPPHD